MERYRPRKYYVYALLHKNVPFWIGKGSGDRIGSHKRAALDGKRYTAANKIRSVWAKGEDFEALKLLEWLDETIAYQIEADLIRLIGRRPNGPLLNNTDGGDGFRNLSPEAIERRTKPRRGKKRPAWVCKKISLGKLNSDYTHSAATREKFRIKALRECNAPGAKERFIERVRKPEVVARMAATRKQQCNTPEGVSKLREQAIKQFSTEEGRRIASEAAIRRFSRPEERQKASERKLGYTWITNGSNTRQLPKAEPLPEGWVFGRPGKLWQNPERFL